MDYSRRHRERGYAGSADHRIDLFAFRQEKVEKLSEQYAARGIENKRDKPESENEKGIPVKEVFSLHFGSDGKSQEKRYHIRENVLSSLGKRFQNATLSQEVTEHKEPNERNGSRRNKSDDDG